MSIGQVDAEREVMIVNTSDGAGSTVPDSSGVSGPVAWTPDGSRIFFGQVSRSGSTTSIATFLLGSNASQRLKIPGVELTRDTTSSSELFVWSKK
jgi:Tol biopolymer transport system component